MTSNVKVEDLVMMQAQTTGIVLALVIAAMAQPSLDRAAYIAHLEKTLVMMEEKQYDKSLLELVRVTLLPFKTQ